MVRGGRSTWPQNANQNNETFIICVVMGTVTLTADKSENLNKYVSRAP